MGGGDGNSRGERLTTPLSRGSGASHAASPAQAKRLTRLDIHRRPAACLYLERLADVDAAMLAPLTAASVAELQRSVLANERQVQRRCGRRSELHP
jgi:hypothetical protein